MANNKLSHLLGSYQYDSDDDEQKSTQSKEVVTDWTQCKDPNTGLPYYYNIVTKEVTWEMPVEYERFLKYALVKYPNQLVQWTVCHSDDNAKYYFNEFTREISWEKPEEFIEPEPSVALATETATTDNNLKTTNKRLNLVPEYDSGDSDDENNDKDEPQVLFPSSSRITASDNAPKEITLPKEPKPKSPIADLCTPADGTAKVQTFASIITGGRSPQKQEDLPIDSVDDNDRSSPVAEPQAIAPDNDLAAQKTFQRKRRIEFHVSGSAAKRSNSTSSPPPTPTDGTDTPDNAPSQTRTLASKYGNFQRGDTEFGDKQSPDDVTQISDIVGNKESTALQDEQCLLESKLAFLCQGREHISPVQIIQIQLKALQAAHIAEALQSGYFLEWMKQISTDLIKLEADAAPDGWKCSWNREKAQYCYEQLETGEVRWQYPDAATVATVADAKSASDDDDAMDISTTPPHNPHEAYDADAGTAHSSAAWSAAATAADEKPLDDELASFYSDIANLAPATTEAAATTAAEPAPEPAPEPSAEGPDSASEGAAADTGAGGVDDKKRKKKKQKVKKVEPWRSGNLETWINKWQQAQKELDG